MSYRPRLISPHNPVFRRPKKPRRPGHGEILLGCTHLYPLSNGMSQATPTPNSGSMPASAPCIEQYATVTSRRGSATYRRYIGDAYCTGWEETRRTRHLSVLNQLVREMATESVSRRGFQ